MDYENKSVAAADTFTFGGKALSTTELEDGDLLIDGFAAVWKGTDRQGENFAPGAFKLAIAAFLAGSAALCFHHKADKVLGKVLRLEEIPNVGLRMVARVDGAIRNHPELGAVYQQIKRGTLTGLSVGGFFRRALSASGPKIVDMDFTEVSITAVPSHTAPAFTVVEGKALELAIIEHERDNLVWLRDQLQARESALENLRYTVACMRLRMKPR